MNGTEGRGPEKSDYPRPRSGEEKSLGELFVELSRDALRLAAQELGLTKIDMSRKVSDVWKYSRYYRAGVLVAYAGFIFILAALVIELSTVIPISLSSLLVGLAALIAGLILMRHRPKANAQRGPHVS